MDISRSKNYRWYVVGMLWMIAFFNYADRQAIFSVFPLLQEEMGLTKMQQGMLGSSFAWVYGLGAPFAGYVVDNFRRKTAILAGLQVWSIICIATVLSQKFWHLIVFRALEGLGETFYFSASMSFISDYHNKETRSRAMGFHQTSVYVGTIAGGFFAGLIGQVYGWRWSFVIFGALGMLLGVILHRFLIEPTRGASDYADAGVAVERETKPVQMPLKEFLRQILGTPTVLLLMGAFMCANFVGVVLLTWMPSFLHERFDMNLAMSGLTATLYVQLASMVAAPLGGWIADSTRKRMPGGRMLVQALGVLCGAPFVVLCGMTQSVLVLIVALTAWGFFKGLYDANIFASVFDVVRPEARGTAAGFMNTVGWLGGGGSAPIVIGFIADRTQNLGFAIATASVVYVMAGVLLLIGVVFTVRRDAGKMQASLVAAAG
ncbi:MAG: MFS transporter [Candidatus Hydrogenedentes bacterium]|nr:MFS transporter [Candidatus Hydrogenedentota bacterium]